MKIHVRTVALAAAAPQATVYVTGYPLLFQAAQGCPGPLETLAAEPTSTSSRRSRAMDCARVRTRGSSVQRPPAPSTPLLTGSRPTPQHFWPPAS